MEWDQLVFILILARERRQMAAQNSNIRYLGFKIINQINTTKIENKKLKYIIQTYISYYGLQPINNILLRYL